MQDPERGAAPAEFVMVGGLLTVLVLSVFQLGLALHVRNTVTDAAAEGARYAAASDPAAAVRAAGVIAESGRAALADMRRVNTLVRESEADVQPQPTLKSTRDLFKVMRDAGMPAARARRNSPSETTSTPAPSRPNRLKTA